MLIFYVHRMLICQPAGTGVYEARAGGGGGGDDEAPLDFFKWTFWTKTSNIWAKPLDLGASAGEYSFGRETSAPPPPHPPPPPRTELVTYTTPMPAGIAQQLQ